MKKSFTIIAFFVFFNAQAQTQDSTSKKTKNLKEISFGLMGTTGISYYPPFGGFYMLSPAFNLKTCYSVHHVMYDVLNSTIQTSHGLILWGKPTKEEKFFEMNLDIYIFGQKSTKNSDKYFSVGIESSFWAKDLPQLEFVPFVEFGTEDFKSFYPSLGITIQPRWLLVNNECN